MKTNSAIRTRINAVMNLTDTAHGRRFDVMIQILILISIVSFSLETVPDLSTGLRESLGVIEAATVAVFTVEYLLRLWVSDDRTGFATSFYGVVDLAAVLPFYIGIGLDARAVRLLRVFRIIQVLKLARYGRALHRIALALRLAKEEIILFLMAASVLIFFASVGIYYFENPVQPEVFKSIPHSLWWAVATLSTVGYGDMYPVTVGGRVFTFLLLMVGLGVVAFPAGTIASALSSVRQQEQADQSKDQ